MIKAGTERLYNFTINGSGGAYDTESNWCPSFAPKKETITLRVEYTSIDVDGVTYMQAKVFVNGELKITSKVVDRFIANDTNGVDDVTYIQIAENNKAIGVGTFYVDNVKLETVVAKAE